MTTKVKASHILVGTEQEAQELYDEIQAGRSFEEAAQEVSQCPSGVHGGDLGYFERGVMVKPFEEAAFNMEVDEISHPVQTQFGWHLIKLFDKK